jgi:hypothetical protein
VVGVRGETHRSLLDDVQDGDGELRIREGVRLGVDLGHFLELLGSGGGAEVSDRSGIERKEGFGARPAADCPHATVEDARAPCFSSFIKGCDASLLV